MSTQADDTAYLVGAAAWLLAPDLRTYEALIRGLPVPCRLLEPKPLKAIGMTHNDPWLVLTPEAALLIEVSRPRGGYGLSMASRRR